MIVKSACDLGQYYGNKLGTCRIWHNSQELLSGNIQQKNGGVGCENWTIKRDWENMHPRRLLLTLETQQHCWCSWWNLILSVCASYLTPRIHLYLCLSLSPHFSSDRSSLRHHAPLLVTPSVIDSKKQNTWRGDCYLTNKKIIVCVWSSGFASSLSPAPRCHNGDPGLSQLSQ